MLSSRTFRLARLAVVGALVGAVWTAPSASAAVIGSEPATIAYASTTAAGDQSARTTTGTFAMSGPLADGGTVRTSYRLAGSRIDATAVLIGARGVFTVDLRGASGATLDGHQFATGRWHVCGGSGAYRHLHGHGRWTADADFGAGPAGTLLPAISGALTGHLHRGPVAGARRSSA